MTCEDCNRHGPYENTFTGEIMRLAHEAHRISHQGHLPFVVDVPDPDDVRHELATLALNRLAAAALHRREDHP